MRTFSYNIQCSLCILVFWLKQVRVGLLGLSSLVVFKACEDALVMGLTNEQFTRITQS
jgi:hypothetical protein